MRHLDLFSGIGGFALAAEMVWPEVEHVFCDNDPFAQAVLKKHWPDSPIYGDIKKLKGTDIGTVDILTGGFPCQPYSSAGKRRGKNDDRHLWPEMLRLIRETNPRWVVAENVGGILTWNGGMVFDEVCADMETEGYAVWPFVIPACAVNAPHRRERVWIVAYTDGERRERCGGRTDSERKGGSETVAGHRGAWSVDRHPLEIATELCTMDDGIRPGMVRPRGWRASAIRAAGNAIVPQVAAEIMRAIQHVDSTTI